MIIDREGNLLDAFYTSNGVVIKDGDYSICLLYDDLSRQYAYQIRDLKAKLKSSDYKALKHADGALSDEEYEEAKRERQDWRDQINALQELIVIPTITQEEIAAAEEKAEAYIRSLQQ